jgi:sulfopyruvate decarboxylase TPP-binding subunit
VFAIFFHGSRGGNGSPFCNLDCRPLACKTDGRRTALDDTTNAALPWPDAIHAQFRRVGIRQVGYVPDAGHRRLIELCVADPDIHDVVLTTEQEGVALAAGAALGGHRAALLMQSSGVGNCINMFSLLKNCGFPCIVPVTMRGEFAEFNPWQVAMGSITEASLKLAGFLTYRVDAAADVEDIVGAACDMAFAGDLQVAVLLSQRLIGRKVWNK